jgi:peptide/nickel transport system permease protein
MNGSYVLRRLIQTIPTLLLASVAVFVLVNVIPGDPARLMLGDLATEDQVAALRTTLGLDRPLVEQYVVFLGRLVRGDLGVSVRSSQPVRELIALAFPATLQLTAAALGLAILIGIPSGIVAALRPRGLFDNLAMVLALLGQAIPSFWLGLTLISVFAIQWQILPTSGRGDWRHLVMPAIALAPLPLGLLIRITRVSMMDVLRQDYIRTARAKGLQNSVVVMRHAVSNALIPVITVMGLQTGALLGGAAITETVFAWPGLGGLAVNALYNRDYPVVQGVVFISALTFIVINLVIDLAYSALDPRIRYR